MLENAAFAASAVSASVKTIVTIVIFCIGILEVPAQRVFLPAPHPMIGAAARVESMTDGDDHAHAPAASESAQTPIGGFIITHRRRQVFGSSLRNGRLSLPQRADRPGLCPKWSHVKRVGIRAFQATFGVEEPRHS
jgi:hypothetical protein